MSIGERGERGERGKTGDHGQIGDPGRPGEPGERGSPGVPPWVVRKATLAYGMLAAGLFAMVLVSQYQDRQNDERDATVMTRFEREAVANDRDFCELARDSRTEINRNREALRTLEAVVRQSAELIKPAPGATAAARDQTLEFQKRVLGLLNAVKIDGNLELPTCEAVGDGNTETSLRPN